MLFFRFIRALWVFGLIFCSYMVQLGLTKIFRRWERNEEGREMPVEPAWLTRRREKIDLRNARRLLRGMLRLRGVYIKLGQVLSIMGGFLPRAFTDELESLQDDVPPRSFEAVRAVMLETLGRSPEELFDSIEPVPVAAASLGQVHVARGHDGAKLAVKILYPGIRDEIRVDMRVMRLALRAYKKFVPIQGIERVHDALVDLLARETDYVHEAACMKRMAENFEGQDDILFPRVIADCSGSDVLTMTFMEGFKITRFEEMEARGIDREAVARRLVESFYQQLFVHRFFHADPHPGNFLVQEGPRLVVLDFGAISEVRPEMVEGMIDVLRGFFEGNDALVLQGIERIGFVAADGDRVLLEKTVKTYFEKLLKVDRTAGALMRASQRELEQLADPELERAELRALMKSVNYPDGWFYVERASVLMFWLVGQIAPDLDTLSVGFPYILPLLAERTAAAAAEQAKTPAEPAPALPL